MARSLRAADIMCASTLRERPLLEGVSLAVGPGEVLCVAGRSGSGKSALLEICAGIRPAGAGQVWWDERPLALMGRQELLDARRSLGFMFQVHALISNLSVVDNVALPLRHHGAGEEETQRRVRECLAWLGLTDVSRALPEDLPYGMQRKAALARAIVAGPDLLILDEPLAGLDRETAQEMVDTISVYWRRRQPALLVSGENEGLAHALGGRRATLSDGRLVEG